jgi:hypothetical protein
MVGGVFGALGEIFQFQAVSMLRVILFRIEKK